MSFGHVRLGFALPDGAWESLRCFCKWTLSDFVFQGNDKD